MGLRAGAAFVDILPKVGRSFGSELENQASGPAGSAGGKVGGIFGSSLGKAAAAVGGLALAKQGIDFFGDAIDAARESAKVSAQTEAVIKSTGGAAKLTAEQFGDLATSISNKTGVDDEAIQSAENLLATFTNVRNEAGKGNDVFSQATEIMVDMGAAMGTEPKAAAIQLGKALNDPIKGISALSRVGVTFTAEQKKTIESMVAMGDTAGAQKVILAELRKEFGGSAAAQATAADRLKVTLGNLQEELGQKLIPLADRVATWAADHLPAALDRAEAAFDRVSTTLRPVVEVVGKVFDAFKYLVTDDDGPHGFAEVMDNVFGNSGRYIGLFEKIGDAILDVAGFIKDHAKPILIGLGAALALLTAPITTVVAALVFAYFKFDGFRKVVDAVVRFLVEEVVPRIVAFAGAVRARVGELVDWLVTIWPQVQEAIGHVFNVISSNVSNVLAGMKKAWELFGDEILTVVGAVWDQIKASIEFAINTIKGIIELVLAVINGDWSKAWDALKDIVTGALDFLKATIDAALRVVGALFSAAWDGIKWAAGKALDGVVDLFKGIGHRIADAAGDVFGFFKDSFKAAFNWIIGAWNDLEFTLPEVDTHIPGVGKIGGWTLGTPNLPELRDTGGSTFPGRDYLIGPGQVELFSAGRGHITPMDQLRDALAGAGSAGGLNVEHLEVKGQEQPAATARETVRALRRLAYLSGAP